MSMFGNDRYRWRETYFVLFSAGRRPRLEEVQQAITRLDPRFELKNAEADEEGWFESITVVAPEDYAALDICYNEGEEVAEEREELMRDLLTASCRQLDTSRLEKLRQCDARFDVLHFEQIVDEEDEDMFDPSALLLVLNALSKLTGGVAVDPQSGTLL